MYDILGCVLYLSLILLSLAFESTTLTTLFIISELNSPMSLHFDQVAQIRITKREFPFHVINLAVGADLKLPISCYDALGSKVSVILNVNWQLYLLDLSPNQSACDFAVDQEILFMKHITQFSFMLKQTIKMLFP
jgi:hypothetical protein